MTSRGRAEWQHWQVRQHAFDVLALDGESTTGRPCVERRGLLEGLRHLGRVCRFRRSVLVVWATDMRGGTPGRRAGKPYSAGRPGWCDSGHAGAGSASCPTTIWRLFYNWNRFHIVET